MNSVVRTAAMAALLVGTTATACTYSKPVSAPKAIVPGSVRETDPQPAMRSAVLTAYTGMLSDYQQDLLTANWQNPVSVHHATGEALLDLENMLAVDGHHGWIGKGTPALHPVVKNANPGPPASAEVVDCADFSHALLYVAATGALKDSTPGGWHLIDAGLVMKDGVWKVSTLAMGQAGSC